MSAEQYHIRDCRFPEDYPAILSMLQLEGMDSPDRDSYEFMQRTAGRPGSVLVAESAGRVCGSVYVGNGDGIGIIQSLVVSPDFRSCGLGSALLVAAEAELAARGHSTAEILVDADKSRLQEWYATKGYRYDYLCAGMVKELACSPHPEVRAHQSLLTLHTASQYAPHRYRFTNPSAMDLILQTAPQYTLSQISLDPALQVPSSKLVRGTPWLPDASGTYLSLAAIPLKDADYILFQFLGWDGDARNLSRYEVEATGWYAGTGLHPGAPVDIFYVDSRVNLNEAEPLEESQAYFFDLLHRQVAYTALRGSVVIT